MKNGDKTTQNQANTGSTDMEYIVILCAASTSARPISGENNKMSKAQTNSNSGSKGNSGNTNGGTQTSFTNTPQAKDDTFGTPQSGQLNYA
ncbi:MAG: hypothetical protein Q8L06_16280, partial [Pseudohongiella sp.]|nr:hypothetical protein [Pseudohongiella sp.]